MVFGVGGVVREEGNPHRLNTPYIRDDRDACPQLNLASRSDHHLLHSLRLQLDGFHPRTRTARREVSELQWLAATVHDLEDAKRRLPVPMLADIDLLDTFDLWRFGGMVTAQDYSPDGVGEGG